MKYLTYLLLTAALILGANTTTAEEGAASVESETTLEANIEGTSPGLPVRKEIKEMRQDFRENTVKPAIQNIKTDRQETGAGIKTIRAEAKENLGQDREENKTIRAEARANIKAEAEALRERIQNERELLKEKRQAEREDIRKKLAEGLRERLIKSLETMERALERFVNIEERIAARIAILVTLNVDTTLAQTALDNARIKTAGAQEAVLEAKTSITEATISTSTDKTLLKETLKTAELSVKEARLALTEAISAVQGLGRPASTSPAQ